MQNKSGFISVDDLGTIARSVGKNITEAEAVEIASAAQAGPGGRISEEELARIMREQILPRRVAPMAEISSSSLYCFVYRQLKRFESLIRSGPA